MITIKQFEFNPFGENTYLLHATGGEAAVIDPGMMIEAERIEFADYMTAHGLTLRAVWLTHCHIDHVAAARYLADLWHVPVRAHIAETPLASALQMQAERFGFNRRYFKFEPLVIDLPFDDGDVLKVGDCDVSVIHTPGHSPGGVSFYIEELSTVLVGDTLFAGSVGRCDLPGGDMPTLLSSIRTRLYALPGDTVVLSGHGSSTTIATEQAANMYTFTRK